MDIFSHGLWTGAAYKVINKKTKKQFNIKQAIFWGVFPDIFAFSISFIFLFINLVSGKINFDNISHLIEIEPSAYVIFELTSFLYSISHSIMIFFLVFMVLFLIFKRPIWELGGWFLHIILDIPTHSYRFYPTPFLWPISDWKFNGLSWATPWFLLLNYLTIIIVYFFLYKKNKN
ncbi:MAG: hypothetical protein KatS3mg095_0940 [Candidatus Parcubacteria bacterium]|nr:MAG: hypothetical protein KatS3mg095_0940 [Candidatus Parcubacteria bacterium]